MPIIPVLTPEGDIPTTRAAIPRLEDLSGSYNAKLAAGIGQVAQAGVDIATEMQERQGQIKAQDDRVKYAYKVESFKKSLIDGPLKPMPNTGAATVEDPDSGEGGSSYPLGLQPKWQTIEGDFKDGLAKIDAEFDKRQDDYTKKYFRPYQSRIQLTAYRSVADEQSRLYDNAQLASAQSTFDNVHRMMFMSPPQQPVFDEATSVASFKIADNRTYLAQTALINDTADMLLKQGMKGTVVEKMRDTELRRLDADTAEAAQHANPDAWLSSLRTKTNEWQQKLDANHRDRLESKAQAAVDKNRTNQEHELKIIKLNAETELGQRLAAGQLTLPDIQSRSKALQGDTSPWLMHMKAQNEGDWSDNPAIVTPLRIKALGTHPPAETQGELNSALNSGAMSSKTHGTLSEAVTRARDREEKRSDDLNVRAMHRADGTMKTFLFPPAVQNLEKPDYSNNYGHALDEANARILQEGEANAPKIYNEVTQKFLARNQSAAEANLSSSNGRLPQPFNLDRDGRIDPAELQERKKAAAKRWGVDTPEKAAAALRAGKWPKELDNEIQMIDQVVQDSKTKTLWLDNSRTHKESGKVQ